MLRIASLFAALAALASSADGYVSKLTGAVDLVRKSLDELSDRFYHFLLGAESAASKVVFETQPFCIFTCMSISMSHKTNGTGEVTNN